MVFIAFLKTTDIDAVRFEPTPLHSFSFPKLPIIHFMAQQHHGVRLLATSLAAILCLIALAVPSSAKGVQLPCAADPFADPQADPCNPLKYVASNSLTGVAFSEYCVIFTFSSGVLTAINCRSYHCCSFGSDMVYVQSRRKVHVFHGDRRIQ